MRASTYACVQAQMHACMHEWINEWINERMYVCMHLCVRIHAWTRACTHSCIHGGMLSCVRACIEAFIAYIHTYIQTDRQTDRQTYIHTFIHTYYILTTRPSLLLDHGPKPSEFADRLKKLDKCPDRPRGETGQNLSTKCPGHCKPTLHGKNCCITIPETRAKCLATARRPQTHNKQYVCMYVCTYVRMYVCTYVRMYVCTYVCDRVGVFGIDSWAWL